MQEEIAMNHCLAVLASCLIFAATQGLWAAPGSGPLDGKMFYGKEVFKGQEAGRREVYPFQDGTFEARRWAATGLRSGPCIAWAEGGAIVFMANGLDADGRS